MAGQRNVAAGTGAPAEPVAGLPVDEVVKADLAGGGKAGVVGGFVAGKTVIAETVKDVVEHGEFGFFVDFLEFAPGEASGHGGAGFVGEGVTGHMGGVEIQSAGEGDFPGGEGLARDAEDEVE